MKRPVFVLALICLSLPAFSHPRNVDTPIISTVLEQGDGSRIAVRYRAIHWGPLTMAAMKNNEEVRTYYNTYINQRLATLETNVQLGIGEEHIDPGQYYLGFVTEDGELWSLVVATESEPLFAIPIEPNAERNIVPFLSMIFSPGVTDRDFLFNVLYGNLSLSIRWMITGIPARMDAGIVASPKPAVTLPHDFFNALGAGSAGGAGAPPSQGVAIPTPPVIMPSTKPVSLPTFGSVLPDYSTRRNTRQKAGSGGFRRYLNRNRTQEKK